MDLDRKAIELKESGVPFCWATVIRTQGSAPREIGAKMIVTAEGSFGTVGGGGLEKEAIDDAREVIKSGAAGTRDYDLTEDGIQPCGGRVEIFLEPVAPPKRIHVFGAGHISEKLCPMLAELGFSIALIDERAERLELSAFNCVSERIAKVPSDVLPSLEFSDDTHVVSLTHKHSHDEEIIRHCLRKPFKYAGLISSRKKWATFCEHYSDEGFTTDEMSRISTPVGIDIGAETPFEIAVAIAAQLIQLHAKPDDFNKKVAHFS